MTVGALPQEIREKLRRAERLEWITIGIMVITVIAMGLVMGSSQAMQTAWVEDLLSLIPPIVFLVTARLERRKPTALYPFGFERYHSIAFLVAAVSLTAMGALLAIDSVVTLIKQERPTVGSIAIFGHEIWQGWLMIGVLALSVIPPVVLGRLKYALAQPLHDKVLHTDALMNKADWLTGLAGVAGVFGIAYGLWWADAAAALIISLDILRDGVRSGRIATAELADTTPRRLDSPKISEEALQLAARLKACPGVRGVRLRETGRMFEVTVEPDAQMPNLDTLRRIAAENWRVATLNIAAVHDAPEEAGDPARAETGESWTPYLRVLPGSP